MHYISSINADSMLEEPTNDKNVKNVKLLIWTLVIKIVSSRFPKKYEVLF